MDDSGDRPPEVQVKKGYSWSEQLGIAVACLIENGNQKLVDWAKEVRSDKFWFVTLIY